MLLFHGVFSKCLLETASVKSQGRFDSWASHLHDLHEASSTDLGEVIRDPIFWPNGIIFHQPRFPWNFRDFPYKTLHFGGKSVVWGRYNLTSQYDVGGWCIWYCAVDLPKLSHNHGSVENGGRFENDCLVSFWGPVSTSRLWEEGYIKFFGWVFSRMFCQDLWWSHCGLGIGGEKGAIKRTRSVKVPVNVNETSIW